MRRSAYSRLKAPSKYANPVVCGRRHCRCCGSWRHVCDFTSLHDRPRTECRACCRQRVAACYRQSSPQQRELRREYERIYREVERRRRGIPPRPFSRRLPAEGIFLPPEPLLVEIRDWLRKGHTKVELALVAGIELRQIHRLETGESRRVRIDIADRLALATGTPLALIYPEES